MSEWTRTPFLPQTPDQLTGPGSSSEPGRAEHGVLTAPPSPTCAASATSIPSGTAARSHTPWGRAGTTPARASYLSRAVRQLRTGCPTLPGHFYLFFKCALSTSLGQTLPTSFPRGGLGAPPPAPPLRLPHTVTARAGAALPSRSTPEAGNSTSGSAQGLPLTCTE